MKDYIVSVVLNTTDSVMFTARATAEDIIRIVVRAKYPNALTVHVMEA